MRELVLTHEEDNRKIGWIASIIIHLLVLLLLLVNFLNFTPPEPGQQGILINLGMPQAGGDSTEEIADESGNTTEAEADTPEAIQEKTQSTAKPNPPAQPQQNQRPRKEVSEVVVDDKPMEKSPQVSEEDKSRKAAEAQRKAEEEARKQKEFEERKSKFGSLLSGGSGTGDQSGEEGNPSGDPDKTALEGLAKGSGKVGGGLGDRGVLFEPVINENSQETGTVVIKICVDSNGNVTESEFTQRGSTTTDITLVNVARKAASKYKFTVSDIEKQCGTVTVHFKVQ